jgi:hypothetical protein
MFNTVKRLRRRASFKGRLAQLDRALVSGTRGRGFKSHIAYHADKSLDFHADLL